ncbi:hypothetical protein PoB_001126300, partial [Plakobranchus ocellatus]
HGISMAAFCAESSEDGDKLPDKCLFELVTVKHRDCPRMDNRERYLCIPTGVILEIVYVMQILYQWAVHFAVIN